MLIFIDISTLVFKCKILFRLPLYFIPKSPVDLKFRINFIFNDIHQPFKFLVVSLLDCNLALLGEILYYHKSFKVLLNMVNKFLSFCDRSESPRI